MKRYDFVAPSAASNSRLLCMDVTVTSHTTKEYLSAALNKPAVNVTNAVTAKRSKYYPHVQHDTEVFVPLAAETSGVIHHNFPKMYAHLGTCVNGQPPLQASWSAPTFTSYWMQRTSVVLWRETARGLIRLATASKRSTGRLTSADGPINSLSVQQQPIVIGDDDIDVEEESQVISA